MATVSSVLQKIWLDALSGLCRRIKIYSSDKLLLNVELHSINVISERPEELRLRFSTVIGLAEATGEPAIAQLIDEKDLPLITATVSNSVRQGEISLAMTAPIEKGFPYNLSGIEFGFPST